MRKNLILLFLLVAFSVKAQLTGTPTNFSYGIKLKNATNDVNIDSIPVMDGNKEINSYITKTQFISQIGDSFYTKTESDGIYARLNIGNTFTESQSIEKASATLLTLKRLGSNANIGIRLQGDTVDKYVGLGFNGELKFGATADLSNQGDLIYHEGNFVAGTDYLAPNGDGSQLTGVLNTVQAGTNITIDNTDPKNPVINSSGGGATNLSYISGVTNGTVTSDTGTNAVIPTVTSSNAGLQKPDFYEEGTFTANVIDNGGGATYSVTINDCTYTRVGNEVTVNIFLDDIDTSGTPTGGFRVENMPFSSVSASSVSISRFYNSDVTTTYFDKLIALISGTNITFGQIDSISSLLTVTMTNGQIIMSVTYITNVYTP